MTVLLVDGNNVVRRIYEVHKQKSADPVASIREHLQGILTRIVNRFHPTHAVVVFDSPEKTWRHFLEPAYKENRPPTPPDLLTLLPEMNLAIQEHPGINSLQIDGYEADDVIATLASGIRIRQQKVTILSTDKGYQQLVDEFITVFDPFSQRLMDAESVHLKQGVNPEQLVDFWALTGDATNNIKGVAGIGPATARKLLQRYQTLDAMLESSPEEKDTARIRESQQAVLVCRQLVTLKTDVELGVNLRIFTLTGMKASDG